MAPLPPRLTSALPLRRRGDGPELCRRFCRLYRTEGAATSRIPTRLRLKDGPYLCVCFCRGFAAQRPIKIKRPRARGQGASRIRIEEKSR